MTRAGQARVALMGVVALVASTMVALPASAQEPDSPSSDELPALRSEQPPEPEPVESGAVFSSPPPIDGDVTRVNEELAAARRDEPSDPAKDKVLARDSSSETIERADGTRTTRVSNETVNYQDASGKWVPLDAALIQGPDGSVTTKSAPVAVRVAGTSDAADLVSVSDDGWSVRFGLEGASRKAAVVKTLPRPDDATLKREVVPPPAKDSPEAEKSPGAGLELKDAKSRTAKSAAEPLPDLQIVEYADALPGVDLRYGVGTSSVKEQVVIKARPDGPLVLRFPLQIEGLRWVAREDGGIGFVDAAGVEVASIPPAVMADGDGWRHPGDPSFYAPVPMRIDDSGDGPVLVMEPDPVWLADPARVFPVMIDPQLIAGLHNASVDARATDCAPGNNYNGAGQYMSLSNGWFSPTNVSGWSWPGCTWVSYQKFDLASLAGKQILNTSLSVSTADTYDLGNGQFAIVRPITADWNPSTVTWGHHMAVQQDWMLLNTPAWSRVTTTDAWLKWWVQHWVDDPTMPVAEAPYANYGLNYLNWGYWTYASFFSAEEGNLWYIPWLVVDWNSVPGIPTAVGPADGQVFTSTTPGGFSTSTVTDPDGQDVKYWLRISTNPGGDTGQVYNSGWVASPDSSPTGFFGASGTVPPGTLQDGVTYYWKVYAGDFASGSSTAISMTSASGARSFKVNLRLGAQGTNPTDSIGPATVNLSNGNLSVTTGSPSFPTVGGPVGLTFSYNSQQPTTRGLRGSYYDEGATPNFTFDAGQEPFVVRDDPRVDFNWGSTSPVPNGPADNVLVQWRGYVTVPSSGNWQFGARSDDGVRIWVGPTNPTISPWNGQLNQWVDQPQPASPQWGSSVSLTAGQAVPIQIDYYERGTLSAMTLYAKPAGTSGDGQIVDASWLSTDPPVLPLGWRASADLDGALGYTGANVSTNQVVITDSSGQPHTYTSAGGGFTPPTGEFATLARNGDGTFTLHDDTGVDYQFSSAGVLLASAVAGVDDRAPAAPKYNYLGTPPRLVSIEDRVSAKKLLLKYSGDAACSTSPPSGFDAAAPSGMLCKLDYTDWGFGVTDLWYVNGQLGRIADPGGEVTDFAYTDGRLTKIRDPLAADAVAPSASPQRANDDTTRTVIHYDSAGRVDSVKLAEPLAGAARPEHQYRYVSPTETQVDVAGLSPASGYARRVVFDAAGRITDDYDATTKHATATWDPRDLPLSSTDPAGIVTSTGYDAQGRATSSSVAGGGTTATSTTTYDGGMPGLLATWWDNKNLTGLPKGHTLGIGGSGGSVARDWSSGAPGPANIPADNFGLRLTGEINLPTTGDYKFRVISDNGVRLYVDDKLIVDQWVDAVGNPWPDSAPVANIAANGTTWHRIRLDYFESVGGANLTLQWIPPGGGAATVPGSSLTPRLDLVTSSQDPDGKTTATGYADPALGLATSTTLDPAGLRLTTSTSYETPSATTYLRRTSRTLPAGNFWTYAYYAKDEERTNPCPTGGQADQGGFLKTRTGPDPDGAASQTARVEETVYDQGGRPVASRVNSESWACVSYDARGRVAAKTIPAFGGEPARTVTNDYAVGGNPLTTKVSDAAGDISATVDLLGRVVAYTDVWNKTTTTSYDQAGRAVSSAGPLGTQAVTYDDAGRVEQVTLDGDVLADPAYDTAGRFDSVAYPTGAGNAGNGTSLAPVARDALGRVNGLTWRDPSAATITSDAVTRSAGGRVTDQSIDGVDADASNPNFVYDGAGRLDVARVPGHTLDYDFDTGARTALFVVDNPASPTASDAAVRDRLVAQGWTVTYADDNGITAGAANGKRLVLISSTVLTANVTTTFRDVAIPVVSWESSLYDDMKMTGTAATEYDVASGTTVSIANATSPLAAGLTGTVTTYTANTTWTTSWGKPSANATVAATVPGQPTQAAVFGYETGAGMVGQNAPARRVGLFLYHDTGTTITADGWKLIDAAVAWAAGTSGWNSNRTQLADTPTGGSATTTTYSYDQADKLVASSTAGMGTIVYDAHGNTTTLGNQTLKYDGADRHVESSASGTTVRYVRDATDRIVERKLNGTTVARYSYTSGGDTPDLTLDASNAIVEKNYGLPGGATLTKRAGGDVWSYPNVHGDVVATANSSGAKQGSTYAYDPYGQPLGGIPDNQVGAFDNGWLGQHQRGLEHQTSLLPIIEMGARQYSPALGRFLEVDPIEGGSCNDYDYVCADPTNGIDLDGRANKKKWWFTNPAPRTLMAGLAGRLATKLGNKFVSKGTYQTLRITRSGGGVDANGNRFVTYKVHVQARPGVAAAADMTGVRVIAKNPGGGRQTIYAQHDRSDGRGRGDYAHTTITIRPGTQFVVQTAVFFDPYIRLGPDDELTSDFTAGKYIG